MPIKPQLPAETKKKKAPKQPQQTDPRGKPTMIVGPTGKKRMGWTRAK